MDECKGPLFEGLKGNVKRQRSESSRRPREHTNGNTKGKTFNLNNCLLTTDNEYPNKRSKKEVSQSSNGIENNKFKKVKLKVGGITRTLETNTTKIARSSDTSRPRQKQQRLNQGNCDGEQLSPSQDKMQSDVVRKSKRVPKKRVVEKDDDEEDDEIRYLEKLKSYKSNKNLEEESSSMKKLVSRFGNIENGGSKSRSDDVLSESEVEGGLIISKCDSPAEISSEKTLTTRQRALLSSKDGASQIEFPNGLPPAPPRKQKEKLTEVEQQLKKTEAAHRRRIQNEKAARESEAEAIKKILGQDASRKKREEQKKKRQQVLAQEKAATAQMNAGTTIRWVMGPTGTVVTFPQEMGLPQIFQPTSSTYPPPREKCAGPNCENPYKYRDSKSKLPLCSLQCYKAINAH